MTLRFFEDNVPQTITSFQHQDIPVSLGILVDNSGSMRAKRGAVNTSALDLVHYSNKDDESFVVNFSDEAYIDQDFTSNVNKLRDGLSHHRFQGVAMPAYDMMASADYLTKNAKRPKQVSRLVVTDGERQCFRAPRSRRSVRHIQGSSRPGGVFDSVALRRYKAARAARRARRALEMLANETGGISFFPKNPEQVEEIDEEVYPRYPRAIHHWSPSPPGAVRQHKRLGTICCCCWWSLDMRWPDCSAPRPAITPAPGPRPGKPRFQPNSRLRIPAR